MNKPAVAIATGVWITNVVFLILGKSLSTSPAKTNRNLDNLALVPGAVQVIIQSRIFCILVSWADSFLDKVCLGACDTRVQPAKCREQ
jgi:hypothetical protein